MRMVVSIPEGLANFSVRGYYRIGMTTIFLRAAIEDDWPAILALADAALPWDTGGNREWLENRKRFGGRRRHYVAEEEPSGQVAGYGAVEEGPEPGHFRLLVVMDPARLRDYFAAELYQQLTADLVEMEAHGAWVREYARDTPILDFFGERGFVEQNRFAPPGYEEMVVLVKRLA
jgi:N-acetylglutamate synthase-like GNAT family acetyltransferase